MANTELVTEKKHNGLLKGSSLGEETSPVPVLRRQGKAPRNLAQTRPFPCSAIFSGAALRPVHRIWLRSVQARSKSSPTRFASRLAFLWFRSLLSTCRITMAHRSYERTPSKIALLLNLAS